MQKLFPVNWPIILSSFLLLSVGILVILSSSREIAIQQLVFAVVGIVLYFSISSVDYRVFNNFSVALYFLIILLLAAVFIFGEQTRGSLRWIPVGIFNIQPSEFAKPALILILARFWSKSLPTWRNILVSLFWAVPFAILIFRQPDLGSSLTVMAIWFGVLVAARLSVRKFLILMVLLALVIPVGWLTLHDYQQQRILSFLTPENDPLGRGYNLIQSTIAVGSGELTGRGLGLGTQSRLQFLPEFRTDFIFASIAEELGFLGSSIIVFLYVFLIIQCIKISGSARDLFGYFLVFGVVSMLLFQTFVNIGMNIGLLPITGITLPLVSYGGSSMLTTFISLALVGSVHRFKKRFDSEASEGVKFSA